MSPGQGEHLEPGSRGHDWSGAAAADRLGKQPTERERPGMAAWQTASTPSSEDAGNVPGRHHLWPDFLVRWLFGRGEEERAPSAASGSVARFQNICISREAGE